MIRLSGSMDNILSSTSTAWGLAPWKNSRKSFRGYTGIDCMYVTAWGGGGGGEEGVSDMGDEGSVAYCIAGDLLQELPVWSATHLQNSCQLVNVVISREQNLSSQQFCHYTSNRPNVNCVCVCVCVPIHSWAIQLQYGTVITKLVIYSPCLL